MKTHHSFEWANVSDALPVMLAGVLMDGEEVGTRQGERSKEILMARTALWKPWQREVLVTGRKASIAAQIAETMWVLAGRNDVEWLSHYLPRAGDFSDDGTTWTGGYGPRIRKWTTDAWGPDQHIDQLARVVDLLNNERGTRRAVINIYDPTVDSVGGKDVPCNNWLSFISRLGKLHMNVAIRSNDLMWGWSGINQFEWSALQEIVAHLTGNQVGTLTFNATSLHVYEKHWSKAADIVGSVRYPTDHLKDSPRFELQRYRDLARVDKLIAQWFEIEESIRAGREMSFAVASFEEPMMRSWLRIIQWYWSGDMVYLEPLKGTRLYEAAKLAPKRAKKPDGYLVSPPGPHAAGDVIDVVPVKVTAVHRDKNTVEVTGEVPPTLVGLFNSVRGMSIINDDMKVQPMTPAQIAAGPLFDNSTRGPKPDLVIKDEPFSTRDKVAPLAWTSQFVEYVDKLHREKSAVYGDSWKRRGEQMAILANIARKVDRLGEGGAGDTAADTVIDLLVYLAKYALWLNQQAEPEAPLDDENEFVWGVLQSEDRRCVKVVQAASIHPRIVALKENFEQLAILVQTHEIGNALQARMEIVDHMINLAFPTARYFWGVENGHILAPEKAAEVITNANRRWEGYEVGENID